MSETAAIRVLVVDDSVVVRRLVTDALRADPQIDVVGAAQNGRVALTKVAELSPDLVIMDVEMPVMDGMATLDRLKKDHPDVRAIILSTHEEEKYIAQAMDLGANGYMLKSADTDEIENAIRPTAVGKKNWLFIGHPNAGQRSAIIYTIIEECRLHQVDPLAYLADVMPRIMDHSSHRIVELLPRQWAEARRVDGKMV